MSGALPDNPRSPTDSPLFARPAPDRGAAATAARGADAPAPALGPAQRAALVPGLEPSTAPYGFTRQQLVYVWLTALFVTALLIANVVGSKFFSFGSVSLFGTQIFVEHSVGMFAFPLTFLLTDLLNEYYGKKGARRVTFIGLTASLVAFAFLWTATHAPPAPEGRTFVPEAQFDRVLGSSGVMIIASMVAFLVGQFVDIFMFQFMKRLTRGKLLWLRATGSTVVSQAVDSLCIMLVLSVFLPLASGAKPDWEFILVGALKGYLIKFSIAVSITPLLYVGRAFMERVFGLVPVPAVQQA